VCEVIRACTFAVTGPDGRYARLLPGSPVTTVLPVSCGKCGVPLDLQVVDWDPTEPAISQRYRCPACHETLVIEVPGLIALAVRRIVTRVPEPK
jgi:hypothetical protein